MLGAGRYELKCPCCPSVAEKVKMACSIWKASCSGASTAGFGALGVSSGHWKHTLWHVLFVCTTAVGIFVVCFRENSWVGEFMFSFVWVHCVLHNCLLG